MKKVAAAKPSFFQSTAGKASVGVLAAIALYFCYYSIKSNLGDNEAEAAANRRHFVCSETGKDFEVTITQGSNWPVLSPYSGKNTGYPAEACYWTKDGQIKTTPTWVLVKATLGQRGPTFCPDCGRLVVVHNPAPTLGQPPPTQAEYMARHSAE